MKDKKCIFDPSKRCFVREAMIEKSEESDVNKYIQPLGNKEVINALMPFVNAMTKAFEQEFGNLHYYCKICRERKP
jgi:hypothetical protein